MARVLHFVAKLALVLCIWIAKKDCAEYACMSTSTDFDIAVKFAEVGVPVH